MFLVHSLSDFSRSALRKLIRDGFVLVNDMESKTGYRVRQGEIVSICIPERAPSSLVPEKVQFTILHEDDSILVLAKPPGIVVHPAAGHNRGTLVHGLLHHCKVLPGKEEGRPGIVHRLDKDTSGIMIVAKTDNSLKKLTEDFHDRKIRKIYHAILLRCPREKNGRIVAEIDRHPVNRKKMAVVNTNGRYAATNWHVKEQYYNGMCLVEIGLETGRTHQIRVHMASIGCPVAGDSLYGGRVPGVVGLSVPRQLLHSSTISFVHPDNGQNLMFTAPLWPDFQTIIDFLRTKQTADNQ